MLCIGRTSYSGVGLAVLDLVTGPNPAGDANTGRVVSESRGGGHGGGTKTNNGGSTPAPKATEPYKRPSGATTPDQRASVQGKPCVDCGATTPKQVADDKTPLVKEHYETGKIDKTRMKQLDAVQPQCPTCSAPSHLKVGVARNVREGLTPINGLRHPPSGGTTGWYIWAGEELSSDPEFFLPLHVSHLSEWCPAVLPYLGLPPGWRFLIAGEYEDVWHDPSLLNV